MFLIHEKKVLKEDDSTKELVIYFLETHSERMNQELASYKKKMNIKYGKQVYKINHDKETTYILSYSQKQAEYLARQNLIEPDHVTLCDLNELMTINKKDMIFGNFIKNIEPEILGGNNIE